MNQTLKETLDTIKEEAGDFDKSFELVDRLLEEYGEDHLASRLYSDICSSINWKVIAELFSILIWSTSDNGQRLTQETDSWILELEDPKKIKIALSLDAYPFANKATMKSALNKASNKFPELCELCNSLVNGRNKIPE